MKKKIYILILLVALLTSQIFASNLKIHSTVAKEESQYTAYLSYLPDHIFTQYTRYYDEEYEQYRSQFQNLSSSSSFQIDPDELRNNDSDKLMNGAFILTVNGLSEDHVLVDQFFDVVIDTGEFYKVASNGDKTSTGIEVKVYDVQYKPIAQETDGGYRISTRTYRSTYDNRGVNHFYLGWTGNPSLGPGRYETDFTFRIIDQT